MKFKEMYHLTKHLTGGRPMATTPTQQPAEEKPDAKAAREKIKRPDQRMPYSGDDKDPEGKSEENRKRREKAERGE
jgi:hypothetical protein